MDLEKVRRAFKRNRFECSVFETAGEAAEYLDGKIDGETVGFGDSLTLQAMGMYEKLSRHNTVFDVHQINRERDGFEKSNEAFLDLARKAMVTDVFLTSVNGVSETGVMVNVDGTGNRVAGSLFGHKKCTLSWGSIKSCRLWKRPFTVQGTWQRRKMFSATDTSADARFREETAAMTAVRLTESAMSLPFTIRR